MILIKGINVPFFQGGWGGDSFYSSYDKKFLANIQNCKRLDSLFTAVILWQMKKMFCGQPLHFMAINNFHHVGSRQHGMIYLNHCSCIHYVKCYLRLVLLTAIKWWEFDSGYKFMATSKWGHWVKSTQYQSIFC